MLKNRSCPSVFAEIRPRVALLRIVCIAFLLSAATLSAVQAQKSGDPAKPLSAPPPKSGGQNKPLPAKSQPTAFYTPEGQQQIADAILTDCLDQLWDQGDAHYDKGEYNHCINLCRVIVQGNPRHVEAFADGAYLLWSTGQTKPAVAFLKAGLRANADSYYMYDELGAFYYYRLKDYPTAVTYYEQAIKYNSPFFTWSGLAHSYEKLNQWDRAVKAWEQASNFVTRGGDSANGKPSPGQAQADQAISATMKHNLARAKAELAKRQKE